MLYPRSKENHLSPELFRHPGSEYRAAPFWAWNCRLDQDELMRQLDVLKQMGMGGAHLHVRTGMATPYLSDEHMALVKSCVEKCRREKLLTWLYDEDRWPSGAAGGLVTRDTQYRARHLLLTATPYAAERQEACSTRMSGATTRSENGFLVACYDVELDDEGCLSGYRRIGEGDEARGRKWYAYQETDLPNPWYNNQTYVNTLDPKAIRRFMDITHERYRAAVGKDFGGVIPAIFTDEPQFSHKNTLGFADEVKDVILPWTDDVPEAFRAAYGEDLLAHLPELLWELPDGQCSVIRYHYHDFIAERFACSFADQCGAWCEEHGLLLTGHMMNEPTLESQTIALGEVMRSYRGFQLPGIDMLCGRYEYTTAKQAQSAARQYGRPGVMSELYGVTGWDFDFRGHKLHGDWQAALGVTVRVPHLAWVSMKGEAKRDYPASIGYQSPWWRDYSVVEDHFARVNTAMTRGRPLVRVGVIHPVESYWLHWGPASQTHGIRSQMDENFANLTQWLVTGGIDFDFISESLLPGQCVQGGAPLHVGEMAYDAIIVPACETLRSTTLDRLEAFRRDGGMLIFLGDAPSLEDARPSLRGKQLWEASLHCSFSREAVLRALEPVRVVDFRHTSGIRTDNLVHQLRQDGDGLWLFVAHAKAPVNKAFSYRQDIRIIMKGVYAVRLYDTQCGDIRPAEYEISGDRTVVQASLYDDDSLLLHFGPSEASAAPAVTPQPVSVTRCPVPQLVDFTLDEPNALLLDKAEFALDDVPYRPEQEILRLDNVLRAELGWPVRQGAIAQPWAVPEETIVHRVRLRFTVHCGCGIAGARLALEDAEIAAIRVNGEAISAAPDGWYVDKAIGTVPLPALHPGDNIIEVELPFGRRTNVEWCYLLGDFSGELRGEHRTLREPAAQLGFDDVTRQGLAYYTGNITYMLPVTAHGGRLRVTVPHYSGAAVRVALDDQPMGHVVYPPYQLELGRVAPGAHMLRLTLLGTRQNGFGPVHWTDVTNEWIGPAGWRTGGGAWTESYILRPMGILSAPWIEEY